MRGRHNKPGALKEAQGNPGHRPIPKEPLPEQPAQVLHALPTGMSADAQRTYEMIGGELRRMNFIKPSDEPLLQRYADTLARFWRVTAEIDRLGGETYEAETTVGGTMQRMRPQFMVQDRLERRLQPMEDRLGLSPMARQQYLVRMAATGASPMLPGIPSAEKRPGGATVIPRRPPPAAPPSDVLN